MKDYFPIVTVAIVAVVAVVGLLLISPGITFQPSEQAGAAYSVVLQYPPLNPGDVVVDASLSANNPPYYKDFSDGLAALSGNGGTMYVLPGEYRETGNMQKDGRYTIQGIGDKESMILLHSQNVDETKFSLYSGHIYKALKSDIGTSTIGIFYEKKTGVLYMQASSLAALNCPGGYWTDSSYIYVYTSNGAAPSDNMHGLEIVFDTGTTHFITNSGANGDVVISNITIKGVVHMTYAVFLGSGENIDLFFNHVVFDKMKSGGVLIYEIGSSWSGTLEFDDVVLSPTYTINYGGLVPTLINMNLGTNTLPKHYVFKDVRIGPVGGFGALEMSNAESTALFDNIVLYGNRDFAHAGIQVHSDPAYGTGWVTVKNSIFAGYDYGSGTEPLLCAAGPGTVSDFAYSPLNQRVKINIENTLFAYPYVGLQFNPPVAGSILTGKNNIFLNGPPNLPANFDIQSWDYNLYYSNNDPYRTNELANVYGTACYDLSCIKTSWDNKGYPNNDEHSVNSNPLFVDGNVDLQFNYDFTPADGSPLCGTGEGGADIGPLPCGGTLSCEDLGGTPEVFCGEAFNPDCDFIGDSVCCGDNTGEYVVNFVGQTRCCNSPRDSIDSLGRCVTPGKKIKATEIEQP